MKPNKNKSSISSGKKVALYFTLVLSIALVVLLFAITNIFTENPFHRKNFMLFFLMILCIVFAFTIWSNYYKDKKKKIDENT
ncbi:MAG: hypothetical protein ABI208_03865 [Ginsengibacter sp.]|jgi:putative effector of murein hydrolase